MIRPFATLIDDYRIWYKITFQRGRILHTPDSSWEEFDRPAHYSDPRTFYGANGVVPAVATAPVRSRTRAEVESFRHSSLHPIARDGYEATDTSTGRFYWNAGRANAPVAILCHGWAHEAVRPIEKLFVEPLLSAGFSVALPSLPFHFERTPAGTYSGEMMVTGDVALTVEAFRQSAKDVCGLVSWLKAQGHETVGLVSYSLGGYVAGLAACLRDDLDFVVIGAAGDSVVSVILDTRLGRNVRDDLSASGMHQREKLERAWGVISPGRLPLRVPRERVLLVAGRHDRIMLASSVQRLWEGWGRPPIRWENEGHYSLLAVPGRLVRRARPLLAAFSREA